MRFGVFYELQLPYGVYIAARMNAELGTDYDIEKMLNWCFDPGQNVVSCDLSKMVIATLLWPSRFFSRSISSIPEISFLLYVKFIPIVLMSPRNKKFAWPVPPADESAV